MPSDRTIVVERFRDEIGDWRVCILSPFGGRVHAPWAMAIAARLREALGVEAQSIWSDDGIALHFPESDVPPPIDELMIDPAEVEDLVVAEVGDTALFGARFRENAGRSLLIPRRRPGERTPLWQQRLKAQSLLQVARKYGSFPVILETYRECLQDVFDLPALRGLLQSLKTREIDLVEVETQSASPYSASLLFDYIATYMYEDDTPPAERRAQALSLDRDLLRELLGQEELRDLLDADAVDEVERQLQGDPKTPDHLHDKLRLRGDLRGGEYDPALAEPLLAERRAVIVRIAGEERLIAAEDAGRYRDALGVMPPSGLPDCVPRRRPGVAASARAALCEGSRPVHDARRRRALRPRGRRHPRASSRRTSSSCAASCGPAAASASGAIPTCCAACAARRWPRCGARSRRSTRRRSRASCPRGTGSTGARRCARRSCRCRRCRCRWRSGSQRCCRAACPATGPSTSTRSRASGEVVWVGAGQDRVALYFREDAGVLGQVAGTPPPEGPEHDAIRAALDACLVLGRAARRDAARGGELRCRRSGISSGRAR